MQGWRDKTEARGYDWRMFFSLKIALASLRAHKLRAVLAMLGVFLGTLALMGVQHVSQSMVRKAELEVEKLGPGLFIARSGQVRFRRGGEIGVSPGARNFTLADARALMAGVPSVLAGAPFVEQTISLRSGNRKVPAQLVATLPAYTGVRSISPDIGRFFTEREVEERAMVVVLGRAIAERLFGSAQAAVGRQVLYFRAGLRVIGVMEPKGRDLGGTDQDEQVFMPLSTYLRRAANQDWISGVYLQLAQGADVELATQSAATILRQRHSLGPGQADDFSLLTARETMRLQQQALDLVQTLGLISSSVSFAVGGLGILSIMVLLVRQRRVEIGIRRALGARRRDIIRQFLFEAGLMSALGGAAGVVAALALVTVVYRLGDFPYIYDPALVLGSLAGSGLLGLAAGSYPARQAAAIEILDVLRG